MLVTLSLSSCYSVRLGVLGVMGVGGVSPTLKGEWEWDGTIKSCKFAGDLEVFGGLFWINAGS